MRDADCGNAETEKGDENKAQVVVRHITSCGEVFDQKHHVFLGEEQSAYKILADGTTWNCIHAARTYLQTSLYVWP